MPCEKTRHGLKKHSSRRSKTPIPSSKMPNLHSTQTGLQPKSHMMQTHGTCVSQSWIWTTPSPRKSSGHKSSCSQPLSPQTTGRKESTFNNATSVGNLPVNTNLVCNTRTVESKDALRARNPALRYADYVEAGNTSKPNTTNLAMIVSKLESLWRRSSRKTGSAPISNAQFAQNHISLIAKTAEDAMTLFNKPEVANLSPTNHSLLRILSSNVLDLLSQYSPLVIKPCLKVPTTLATLDPNVHMHSKTSRQMLLPDPLIKHHAINPSL